MSVTVHTYTKEQQAKDAAERNAWFLKVNGREMNYEDVIKSFGGRFVGESQVEHPRNPGCSENDGILNQT